MALSYHAIDHYNPTEPCYICYENLSGKKVIAHDGEGYKHLAHEECTINWFKTTQKTNCCICNVPINLASLGIQSSTLQKTLKIAEKAISGAMLVTSLCVVLFFCESIVQVAAENAFGRTYSVFDVPWGAVTLIGATAGAVLGAVAGICREVF